MSKSNDLWGDASDARPKGRSRPSKRTRKLRAGQAEKDVRSGLANRVRQAYTLERRIFESMRDGNPSGYTPSKRWDGVQRAHDEAIEGDATESTWMKVATELRKKDIDPVDYVRKVFAALRGRVTSPPMPNQLLSKRSLDLYYAEDEVAKELIATEFVVQRNEARRQVIRGQSLFGRSMIEATRFVVFDEDLRLSPLFRYCLARSMKRKIFRPAYARYRAAAVVQYVPMREEYDRVWGEWIPDDFKSQANSLYERLLAEA